MAATPSSLTTISALLKPRLLDSNLIQNSMIDYGPLTMKMLLEADTSCGGSTTPFPLIYSGGGGFGSSMSAAYATATPAASVNFAMTRGTSYGQVVLGGEAMAASENPDGAFIADLALEIDTKRKRLHEYMANTVVYGDGTGAAAQINTFTSGVILLTDLATAAKFQVGDAINLGITSAEASSLSIANWAGTGACTTTGAGSAPGTTIGILYVIAVNIPAGQITVSATPGGSALSALSSVFTGSTYNVPGAGSYIYFNGDATALIASAAGTVPSNSGGLGPAIPSGLFAWIPVGGPASSGDSFFTVNRYGNSSLYGQAIDATSAGLNLGTIRSALTNAVSQQRQVGSKVKRGYLHPIAFYKLSLELQSQGMYPGSKGQGPMGEGSFGFSSMVLPTDSNDVEIISDPQCMPCLTNGTYQAGTTYSGAMTAFLLDDNWECISKGDIPHLDETDGNYFLRIQGTDNFQIQEKGYWNIGTHRPNGSCAVFLPQ